MAAACVRTTRPATEAELALVREQGKFRGALGCLAVPLAFVLFGTWRWRAVPAGRSRRP